MIRRQSLARRIKHEPREILVVSEDEGADGVVVEEGRFALEHVVEDCAVPGEAVCLQCDDGEILDSLVN